MEANIENLLGTKLPQLLAKTQPVLLLFIKFKDYKAILQSHCQIH